VESLDQRIVEVIGGLDWPVVTPLMKLASVIGGGGILWMSIALVVSLRRRDSWPAIVTGLALVIGSIVSTELKAAIGRERPSVADPDFHALIPVPGSASMPSGHAVSAFAAATVLSAIAPRLRWPLFGLAVTIALSRIYLGVHYPSDVLVGALLGVAVGLSVLALRQLLVSHVRPRHDRDRGQQGEKDAPREAPAVGLVDDLDDDEDDRDDARGSRDLPGGKRQLDRRNPELDDPCGDGDEGRQEHEPDDPAHVRAAGRDRDDSQIRAVPREEDAQEEHHRTAE
jgi:undecaprenyl-diphosphatase